MKIIKYTIINAVELSTVAFWAKKKNKYCNKKNWAIKIRSLFRIRIRDIQKNNTPTITS